MNSKKAEPLDTLSRELFWDVDTEQIDPLKHRDFLIIRCVERGCRTDVQWVWDFYGPQQFRETLLNAPSLGKKTIAFFASQFDLPPTAFRAYGRQQNWES
ncbi:MAG: hypothetical protein GVY36_11065 [Verrucomicrobia bacterium]|nr:hypothetical protein [Verrucomicrobiota bacterium]